MISGRANTKDEKSDMITEQLLFYLKMELMANIFPQRVNVNQCRERTEQEILALEQKRSEESTKSFTEEVITPGEEKFTDNKMAIKTDRTTIKDYVNDLFEKMKGREGDLLSNLSSPLQRNPLEILMHLQNTIYELEEHEQMPFQQSVLPVDIYLDIERGRRKVEEEALEVAKATSRAEHEAEKKAKGSCSNKSPEEAKEDGQISNHEYDPEHEDILEGDSVSSYTKEEEIDTKLFNLKCEWENIHNKAIFDAVNEALDGVRPYGLKGPPLPWSKQNRALTFKNNDSSEIPRITDKIEKRVLSWVGDQDTMDPNPNAWEDRLAVILANEIEETEPIWTDYEFEETHVKIDMTEMILEDLFQEAAQIMAHRKVLPKESDVSQEEPKSAQ